MNLLITGGAGFVGGALARCFRRADNSVVVFDNLHRRGSEWNVERLRSEGVTFVHGDVRNPADLEALEGTFDVLIEASAEPSVHAGIAGSPRYVLDTNLVGALNLSRICAETLRRFRLSFNFQGIFDRAFDAIAAARIVGSLRAQRECVQYSGRKP